MTNSYLRLLKITLISMLSLPLITVACSQALAQWKVSVFFILVSLLFLCGSILICFFVLKAFSRYKELIKDLGIKQAVFLDQVPLVYVSVGIFLSAAVSLALQLCMIRWQGEIFPVFAFYKNFSLLACFAGLGIGYALSKKESILLVFSIPLLGLQILLLTFLRNGISFNVASLMATPLIEQLNMGIPIATSPAYFISLYALMTSIFLSTSLIFIPIGQTCGRLMARMQNLRAYGFNLLGSIFGVFLTFGFSLAWTPPTIWFGVCFLFLLAFQAFRRKALFWGAVSSVLTLIILSWPVSIGYEKIYSPYQLIERGPEESGLMAIRAAGHYFQRVLDLSNFNANRFFDPRLVNAATYYEFPYYAHQKPVHRVAIVGSGAGNDVAAALRQGARQIDAIEIDPVILKLGKMYHPEAPYNDHRVRSIVNDARTFLRTTHKKYDLIIYALLDSHTLLSHASSVRLDSFVYTVEGFKEARDRLESGGLVALSFSVLSDEIGKKIYLMLQEAFEGIPPVCVRAFYDGAIIFLQNKEGSFSVADHMLDEIGLQNITEYYKNQGIQTDVATDDWPFFYMPRRTYPFSYFGILGLIALMSCLLVVNFFSQRLILGHRAFFFLGVGFMLVETKAITEIGLVLGNTWQVIGIVIFGILFMAFLANLFVSRVKISNLLVPFILLIGTLIVGFFIARQGGFSSTIVGKLSAIGLLTCPVFFAGILFSTLLDKTQDIPGAMAINLLGAILGGVLEYNSMYFGFSFLYLLAIGFYGLAMVSLIFERI